MNNICLTEKEVTTINKMVTYVVMGYGTLHWGDLDASNCVYCDLCDAVGFEEENFEHDEDCLVTELKRIDLGMKNEKITISSLTTQEEKEVKKSIEYPNNEFATLYNGVHNNSPCFYCHFCDGVSPKDEDFKHNKNCVVQKLKENMEILNNE